MLVIVDYGMGNLRSVLHKLGKLDVQAKISSDTSEIRAADKIVLPGVGSFGAGMSNLTSSGLRDVLEEQVMKEKVPILGICLGMQLFTGHSEEGDAKGLGWIKADTKRFSFEGNGLRIPHVGWNTVDPKVDSPLFTDLGRRRFYFVHSYHVECANDSDVLATTDYGFDFASVIGRDNIVGVQFHPEKSHKDGIQFIKNFVDYF